MYIAHTSLDYIVAICDVLMVYAWKQQGFIQWGEAPLSSPSQKEREGRKRREGEKLYA